MSVVLSNAEVGPCRRELRIEVPAPAVDAEHQRVVEDFRRKAKIPGFRPGKAPAGVVAQRFHENIHQEVVDRLLPRYWKQAQAETGLDPLLPPSVNQVHLHHGEPLVFVATVDVRPEIELRNYHDFELPPIVDEVGTAEVEQFLDGLRRSRGRWNGVERPAQRGDLVEGKVIQLGAGDEPDGEPSPVRFEVGAENVWEEISLAATGLPVGRSTDFTRVEEAGEEPPTSRRFRLAVDAVKELELPAADDEFAKGFGAEGLEALKTEIAARLRHEKRSAARGKQETLLLDQLCERHVFPLPEAVIEGEVRDMVTEYARHLVQQGVDIERATIDWDRMATDARPTAEKRVRARLLLDAIAGKEGITVSEQDFEATIAALARAEGRPTPALRKELDEAGKLGSLRARLRRDRTLRRLLGEDEASGTPAP
ncbi:MAG TPA: trigger factor [Thermoanaerobaculia bacterium]|nr:trigger factor [Thermoanaerobaculia bacterium]